MKTKTKTLIAIAVAAALGGTALAGASYAGHRGGGHGMGFLEGGPLGLSAMEVFDAIDADGDGTLSQAEVDAARNDRHAAHDADGDGNLSLEEFAGLWHETTRPLTVRVFQMLDTDGDAVVTPRRVRPPARRARRAARPRRRRRALAAGPPAR